MKINQYIVLSILCLLTMYQKSSATNYYVNPSSTSSLANGTFSAPWKTIAQVNAGTTLLVPGDSVLFKRGEAFTGELFCWRSGTFLKPIVYSAYGTGEKPQFTHTKSDVIAMYNQQFVIIDNLKVIDLTMNTTDHSITAKISYGIVVDNSPFCTIQNCDISLVGVGIEVTNGSNNTTITNNYIHNLRIVRNTIGGDDDYGANAMVIGSSSNIIKYNIFEGCWAYCYDYFQNGGAIEFYGSNMNQNIIEYNTAKECDGFIEIGSNGDGTSVDNTIAYNKLINCGPIGIFHNGSGFTVNIFNTKIYNNVIIATKKLFPSKTGLFWFGDNTKIEVVDLKNNILWLTSGINFMNDNVDTLKLIHNNNIFRLSDGTLGINLDPTEISLTNQSAGALFKDTTGLPENWDIHLKENSPAINFGVDLGLNKDFDGNPIIGNPDVGIYEYTSTTSNLFKINITADSILCNGGATIVRVNAINGTPPYIGVGNFTVTSGTYKFMIEDAKGLKSEGTISLGSPSKININVSQTFITTINGTVNVTVTASGGTPPYMYSIDNGPYQYTNLFTQIDAGAHLITVKDANNCIATFNNTILEIPITPVPSNKLVIRVSPNPSSSSFTLSSIKYKNNVYPMSVKVYNLSTGVIVFSTQTFSNRSVVFGNNFLPGNYVIVVQLDGIIQALQLIKL